jgi:ABC-type sugar transport system ATPase subunit
VLLQEPDEQPDAVRVRANEIVGLAGLLGSGADRALKRIFGIGGKSVYAQHDRQRRISNPRAAIRSGIGMVPGERRLGLVPKLSVRDNILLPSLDVLKRAGHIDRRAGDRLVAELIALLDIRPPQPQLQASSLSGGNQQKVILAKWLARKVGLLLLDEPTQGVDIGAKLQIHGLVRKFAANGGGVLVSSSDLAELTRICDTILALRQGRITSRLTRSDGFDEKRLHAAIGG